MSSVSSACLCACTVLMALAAIGGWLWLRGRLLRAERYLKVLGRCWPLGFVALLSGWMVTESGRQPWIIQGILRTADAASPVSAGAVLASLILFLVIYGLVFSTGIYYIRRLLQHGPASAPAPPEAPLSHRPLAAAETAAREAAQGGRDAAG